MSKSIIQVAAACQPPHNDHAICRNDHAIGSNDHAICSNDHAICRNDHAICKDLGSSPTYDQWSFSLKKFHTNICFMYLNNLA